MPNVTSKQVIKHAKHCQKLIGNGEQPPSLNEVLSKKAGHPVVADLCGLGFINVSRLTKKPKIVDFNGVNLSGAILSKTELSGVNLSGANLSGADLSGANLCGTNLTKANLSGANLSGACLMTANLSGANLTGANLSGADLQTVISEKAWFIGAKGVDESEKPFLAKNNIMGDNLNTSDPTLQRFLGQEVRLAHMASKPLFNKIAKPVIKLMVEVSSFFNKKLPHGVHTPLLPYFFEPSNDMPGLNSGQQDKIIAFAVNELHKPFKDKNDGHIAKTPEFLQQILTGQKPVNKNRAPVQRSSSFSLEK